MKRTRHTGLVFLLLCSAVSSLSAFLLQKATNTRIPDFRIIYIGTRCLIEHRDPYSQAEFMQVFREQGGQLPHIPGQQHSLEDAVMSIVYLPSAFLLVAPFATLAWGTAQMLWTISTICVFTIACCLMWTIASEHSPVVSACLLGIILANSEALFAFGNAAGVAVGLSTIAVWCFVRGRLGWLGVICLGISVSLKPHDCVSILILLIFARGNYRKRGVQTMLVAATLGTMALLWIVQVSPHWLQELNSNVQLVTSAGGIADPGPTGASNGTGGYIISLQSVLALFRDDPHFYNAVTDILILPFLLGWLIATLRYRGLQSHFWLSLAALIPMSMLPVYHRSYDAKLLLLAVPGCALLWTQKGRKRWFALGATLSAILLTSDIPGAAIVWLTNTFPKNPVGIADKLLAVLLTRPATLALFFMTSFYVYEYWRQSRDAAEARQIEVLS